MLTNIFSLRTKASLLSGMCSLLAFYHSPLLAEPGRAALSCAEIATHNFPAALQLELREAKVNEVDAFCQVKGIVNSRVGIDGKHYGIEFEMRLPFVWNERFLYQMNGGNDGSVVAAEGDASNLNAFAGRSARARGYAVLSTNAGHAGDSAENQQFGLAASNRFGLDPQAREDYGYATTATMRPLANEIINLFYGKSSTFSYLAGCSNGGRHGMVAASRYGDMFDGILVGAPGFNLPKAALQHAWDVQRTQQVDPKLHNAFSRADMKLIANKVLEVCDQLDNVKDGLVNNIQRCQHEFNINNLRCKKEQSSACLSHLQIQAFSQIMNGPRNSRGENLYNTWWYDAGVADEGWRFWKFESPIPAWNNNPLIATMGAGSLAYLFTTPPTEVGGTPEELLDFLSKFDFDRDAPKIFATNNTFKKSAMEIMTPPDSANPRLAAFNKHGGKLIIYQGQSDPVFSTVDVVKWYEKLNKNYHGKAQDFARLFVVPGMNHCSGGPATDQFDGLAALEKWVEQGIAPDSISASVSAGNQGLPVNWSPTRTRPLCPWPRFANYHKGDIESATSFVCL